MPDIINQINDVASLVSEEDLDEWMVPKLLEHYSNKINSLANKAYGISNVRQDDGPTVSQLAFKQSAKEEIRNALYTFIFKSEHWKSGRDINTYLLTTLNRLSNRIKWNNDSVKKVNALVCPACKFLNKREFLTQFGDLWKCSECSGELERAEKEIKKLKESLKDNNLLSIIESRLNLFKCFFVHSRKGYRCPDCERFIPESCNGPHGIICPYPDCIYFGDIKSLDVMMHPVALTQRNNLSLQISLNSDGSDGASIQDIFKSDSIDADVQIEFSQNFNHEFELLSSTIEKQLTFVKRNNSSATMLQKVLMYEAYQNMLKKHPEDMVSYLVHRKQNSDFPIQAKIFQEYVRLMQNALPCTIKKGKKEYEIVSLMDPNISLFEGISEFDAVVKSDLTIPNNTVETYTGGRKFKDYGPCFIGLIIDIIDNESGKSIRNEVVDYSFVKIRVSDNVLPGTSVKVKHYRIPSHYEMKSLVYLQRVRKKIVDKVYFKIHKKQRGPGV